MDDLEDRVKELESTVLTKQDLRELYGAKPDESISEAAKRFHREADKAREDEQIADTFRRIKKIALTVTITALVTALLAYLTGRSNV